MISHGYRPYHKPDRNEVNKVLDKIRAEIDAIEIHGQIDEYRAFLRTGENVKQMVLNIIDKYTGVRE